MNELNKYTIFNYMSLPYLFLIFSIISANLETMASSYFVSANGDDSNNGTNEKTAWRTIDKVNTTLLKPGDAIYFHRGDLFSGQLEIGDSGKPGSLIEIAAYGVGAKPVLCGAVPVKSWTVFTNGIYATRQTNAVTSVYMNDDLQCLARYPNTGFCTIERGDKTSLVDGKGLPTGLDLTGATVRIRACDWQWEVMKVASQGSNQINFTQKMMYQCSPGYGYFLENKLAFLDSPGEWFYDSTGKMLYFMPPENINLARAKMEATVYGCGIIIDTGVSNVAIQGLNFVKYGTAAVHGMENSSQVSICDCSIRNIGVFGVTLDINCQHYRIENNLIEDIGGRGISALESSDNDIAGNIVRRIGLLAGCGFDGENNAIGIAVFKTEVTYSISKGIIELLKRENVPPDVLARIGTIVDMPYPDEKFLLQALTGKLGRADAGRYSAEVVQLVKEGFEKTGGPKLKCCNNRVAYNVVENTGYDGVRLDGQDSVAECNIIKNTLLRMCDGGALYCWAQNANYTFNNVIRSNIIINVVGNAEGTPGGVKQGVGACGIYLDNKTHHIHVDNNILIQSGFALDINDESHDQQIIGNTCYDNRCGLLFSEYLSPGTLVGCEVYGNILFGKKAEQRSVSFESSLRDNFRPALLDTNVYGGVGPSLIRERTSKDGAGHTRDFTLQEWQGYYGQDAHTTAITGRESVIFVNEGKEPAQYLVPTNSEFCDLEGRPVGKEIELQPFACEILVKK
jgi:hypothetical protein